MAQTAEQQIKKTLRQMPDRFLAKVLATALKPRTEDEQALAGIFRFIVAEAEQRVGHIARKIEAAEDAVFNQKYGIREDMSEAELDRIFDGVQAADLPRGTAPILVEALQQKH